MEQAQKNKLLKEASAHVRRLRESATLELPEVISKIEQVQKELDRAPSLDLKLIKKGELNLYRNIYEKLQNTCDSPYFARCDIQQKGEAKQVVYFGKFSLPEYNIYSWVAPASKIRFNKLGPYSFLNDDGFEVDGSMSRNDQYLVANSEVTFMTTEDEVNPRTLVFQKYFTDRKSSFILPEVVERMERAQDDVIRADYNGSFMISGPAGSGKTTLALHRIAYLLQAPESSSKFTAESILVLVQDQNTKNYFESLLPSLGIHGVNITTFSFWARQILGLPKINLISRPGRTEIERDQVEAAKNHAIKKIESTSYLNKPYEYLHNIYKSFLGENELNIFIGQQKNMQLDRYDMTALLAARIAQEGALCEDRKAYKNITGLAKYKLIRAPLSYSMILIDEIQNYLPEQIKILRSCIADNTKAMTYVGDLAQQTNLFSLRQFAELGEYFREDRKIELQKVYRSTSQILSFTKSIGFPIEVPVGLRSGEDVVEIPFRGEQFILETIDKITNDNKGFTIGILGFSPEDVAPFKLISKDNIRVLTVSESQGVEFDIVVLLADSLSEYLELINKSFDPVFIYEKKKVIKDQIYVGLTRAMNRLYVVSSVSLKEIVLNLV